MSGLSPNLSCRLREIISHCGPFDSDRSLRAVFVDTHLARARIVSITCYQPEHS